MSRRAPRLPPLASAAVLVIALLLCVRTDAATPPPGSVECNRPNCAACLAQSPSNCEVCDDGYFRVVENNDGICYKPESCKVTIDHCTGCIGKDRNLCGACKPGYDVYNNACRAPCDSPACDACGATKEKCARCKATYNLVTVGEVSVCLAAGACAPDATACYRCEPTDAHKCVQCSDGYGMVNGQCELCNADSCRICKDGSTTQCAVNGCLDGFIFENGQCVLFCKVENCGICEPNDRTSCSVCLDKYKLKEKDGVMVCVSGAVHQTALVALLVALAVTFFAL